MKFVVKKLNKDVEVTGIVNVHFFEFENKFSTPLDSHPFFELVYVSNGELFVESENFNGLLSKNHAILHYPNEKHRLELSSKHLATVIIIGFVADGILDNLIKTPFKLSQQCIKILAETVKEGRNVFAPPHDVPVFDMKKNKNQQYGAENMLKILLERLIITITREYIAMVNDKPKSEKLNVSEIIAYLDEKYLEKMKLSELAFIFNTNRTTLCKEFKKATKTTILNYIQNKTLDTVKELILTTDKTFCQIANELNFESIHYFTMFFKKKVGITPKEFKKSHKKTL